MDMFLWDKYSQGEINDNIKYWVDLWEDLIDNFKEKLYGLSLENPRLLLIDIVDEIETNNFKNTENRNYFYKKVNEALHNDLAIRKLFKTELTIIRGEFGNQRWAYLKQLCKNLLVKIEDGTYFKETLSILKDILLSDKDDKQSIRMLSQNLIIEFLFKGFSLKTTKELAKNIFDKYYIREDGHLITDFPCSCNRKDLVGEEASKLKEFYKKVAAEIDSMTIPERIDKLEYYFSQEPTEGYFIFEVEGLKGEVDINIGDVNFYSTKVKSYLKEEGSSGDEDFFRKDKEKRFINAAVRVSMLDSEEAENYAIEKVNKALDLLRVYYSPNTSFEILPSYLVVDEKGKEMAMALGRKKSESWSRWIGSLDLKDLENIDETGKPPIFSNSMSEFLSKAGGEQSVIEKKVTDSLHWYRKGEETINFEDKMINYWIVLENLLKFNNSVLSKNETVFSLSKEVLSATQGLQFIYNKGWVLHNYLERLIYRFQNNRKLLSLPHEILVKCNLAQRGQTTIYLKSFIDNLTELNKFVDRSIIKEKIESTAKFYANSIYAKKVIEEFLDMIKEDILLIYRYRNKIVHNAHYDNTILPYYVEKIRRYAGDLLRIIIEKYVANKSITVQEVILEQYGHMNNILEKLKTGCKVDFLSLSLP